MTSKTLSNMMFFFLIPELFVKDKDYLHGYGPKKSDNFVKFLHKYLKLRKSKNIQKMEQGMSMYNRKIKKTHNFI